MVRLLSSCVQWDFCLSKVKGWETSCCHNWQGARIFGKTGNRFRIVPRVSTQNRTFVLQIWSERSQTERSKSLCEVHVSVQQKNVSSILHLSNVRVRVNWDQTQSHRCKLWRNCANTFTRMTILIDWEHARFSHTFIITRFTTIGSKLAIWSWCRIFKKPFSILTRPHRFRICRQIYLISKKYRINRRVVLDFVQSHDSSSRVVCVPSREYKRCSQLPSRFNDDGQSERALGARFAASTPARAEQGARKDRETEANAFPYAY